MVLLIALFIIILFYLYNCFESLELFQHFRVLFDDLTLLKKEFFLCVLNARKPTFNTLVFPVQQFHKTIVCFKSSFSVCLFACLLV